MLFIVNKNIPAAAVKKLEGFGSIMLFETNGITYPAISNHPDIFFCVVDNKVVYTPNTPAHYIKQLKKNEVDCIAGNSRINNDYPFTAKYNAVVTNEYLIHNSKITDDAILKLTSNKKTLDVKQGYARCSLLPLKMNHFVTSDKGIEKRILAEGLSCLYASPEKILLPGCKHGFFGGACGVVENFVFILGSLNDLAEGKKVKNFLNELEYKIIELYDGKLFDGGSIIIIKC